MFGFAVNMFGFAVFCEVFDLRLVTLKLVMQQLLEALDTAHATGIGRGGMITTFNNYTMAMPSGSCTPPLMRTAWNVLACFTRFVHP
jgi:hypothetical protein